MRVDKFLHDMNVGTRTQIRQLVRQSAIKINDQLVKTGRVQIDPKLDIVKVRDNVVTYRQFFYYQMNKPVGVVTATADRKERTVMDLFNKTDFRNDLFPVGRLDKDTEGLLLITNNGELAHELISPNHHVDKVYEAVVTGKIGDAEITQFSEGITLKDQTKLKPAQLEVIEYSPLEQQTTVHITISEGKYHQIKRMFGSVGQKVVKLKRIQFGSLKLKTSLLSGTYRELTESEINSLLN